MSMWLNVAVLSETGFEKLQKQSDLLDGPSSPRTKRASRPPSTRWA
jgi:hypothetical protein